ncbi:hypothetical protein [Cellulomonas septica]|uniref:Uncharacterized protein n=1 Tax=Cellulomonas septica TaxID=285080 RepID=A0ABX1K056_9CELL|nr:hypothetical protein [Cellulomonas septica]NKY39959.1 hypothetical protein [Cellulomonas septica]
MEAHQVDERDTQWEVVDATYRVVVVTEGGTAFTTFDLSGCTAADALRWAADRPGAERSAVAVRLVDSGGRPGIVWLTPPPESAAVDRRR